MPKREQLPQAGLTLIELLIAMAVSSILAGVVILTLQTSLDTFSVVQDEAFLQKALDETLQVLSDGDYEDNGIKDALTIVRAGKHFIDFVPLWVDELTLRKNPDEGNEIIPLSRPFKPGASLPIGEILVKRNNDFIWKQEPITFFLSQGAESATKTDTIIFNNPLPQGTKARVIYQPETPKFSDTLMHIEYLDGTMSRHYRNKKDIIPKHRYGKISFDDFRLQYFDNTNREILPEGKNDRMADHQISNITAVKLSLRAHLNDISRRGSVFINLRNTRAAGAGLIVREGTSLTIPDSKKIRALSLLNLTGIKDKGEVILEASNDQGKSYRVILALGIKDDHPVIERYTIEYPAGTKVYSENIEQDTTLPFNLLTAGRTGRYDYDADEDGDDVVLLEGEVTLKVVKMDAAGAALFVRP